MARSHPDRPWGVLGLPGCPRQEAVSGAARNLLGLVHGRVMAKFVTGELTCRLTGETTHRREVGYCTTASGIDINRAIIASFARVPALR